MTFPVKLGSLLVGLLVLAALFAPWFSPHDPNVFFLDQQLAAPHQGFWFGHDAFGRCILSRVWYGARISLSVGVLVVGIGLVIGVFLGLLAGWYGGALDALFLLVSDVFLAFPGFLLAIALAAFVGPSFQNVVLILSLLGWVGYARLVRGQVLGLKEKEFVQAARGLGATPGSIMVRHLLPNLAGPLLVHATFSMAGVILVESSLSFLGLGMPQGSPSWGNLLDEGVSYLLIAPHLSIFPGLCIMLTVLGFNFLGDGLRDRLDPGKMLS